MDTVFAEAVAKVSQMSLETQRFIGEVLLDGVVQPELPVIEFSADEHAMLD